MFTASVRIICLLGLFSFCVHAGNEKMLLVGCVCAAWCGRRYYADSVFLWVALPGYGCWVTSLIISHENERLHPAATLFLSLCDALNLGPRSVDPAELFQQWKYALPFDTRSAQHPPVKTFSVPCAFFMLRTKTKLPPRWQREMHYTHMGFHQQRQGENEQEKLQSQCYSYCSTSIAHTSNLDAERCQDNLFNWKAIQTLVCGSILGGQITCVRQLNWKIGLPCFWQLRSSIKMLF